MDQALKIVTRLPLRELWRDDGFSTTERGRSLESNNIAELLRVGPVHFVVIDIGARPRWVALTDCYQFWKDEAKIHVAALRSKAVLDQFPGGYCYFASEWDGGEQPPIVVLERYH